MMRSFLAITHQGRQYRAYLTPSGIGRVCTLAAWAGKTVERDLASDGPRRQAVVALAEEKARR